MCVCVCVWVGGCVCVCGLDVCVCVKFQELYTFAIIAPILQKVTKYSTIKNLILPTKPEFFTTNKY